MKRTAEDVLDELEEYLNSAKYGLFSNSKITVDRLKMQEYIRELREHLKSQASDQTNI